MSRLLQLYHRVNTTHPTVTQIVTIATLMGTGDVISQKVIEKREKIDLQRTARFFAVGIVYVGPVLRNWYPRLDRLISKEAKMRGAQMVFWDQFVFSPVFVPGFLVTLSVMKQHNFEKIKQTLKDETVSILLCNWMVWPAAQMVNFNFVPLQYRVLFASVVSLFWNVFLSWKANQEGPTELDALKEE